jgi:hypothetical protein
MYIYSIKLCFSAYGYILDNAFLGRSIPEQCVLSPTTAAQTSQELRCLLSMAVPILYDARWVPCCDCCPHCAPFLLSCRFMFKVVSIGKTSKVGTQRLGTHLLRDVSFERRIVQGTHRSKTKVRGRSNIAPVRAILQPFPDVQAASTFIQLSYLCISCFRLFLSLFLAASCLHIPAVRTLDNCPISVLFTSNLASQLSQFQMTFQ